MRSAWKALIAVLLAVSGAACYKPNVISGGLACSAAGTCPEGLRCSPIDMRCYRGDAGPEVEMCSDARPSLVPICDDPPVGGDCNPFCQGGCKCGRCTVVNGVSTCAPTGTVSAGGICNLAADDCLPGLGCVKDVCGTSLGRCRKFCQGNEDCRPLAGACSSLTATIAVCDPPSQACDPMVGSGCPDVALSCYLSGGRTTCECAGTKKAGEPCDFSPECIPGFQCVGLGGGQQATCLQVCRTVADCLPPNTRCVLAGGGFGGCST